MDGTLWYGSLHLTCYVDELCIVIYIYGWNYVYGWNLLMYEQCVWMKLMWYVIWNLCAGYVLDMWYETYIFSVQIVGFNKKQKKQTICRLFAVCHRRQRAFAVCRGRQRSHVAANCASWELTHLVSLPTVADDKDFAVRGRRQRTCTLPSVADGKEPAI